MEAIKEFQGEYRWLSNFWQGRPISLPWALNVPTAEHIYQSMKTLDLDEMKAILRARTPFEAKSLGSKATLRPDWEDIKVSAMRSTLAYKFFGDIELAWNLVDTGDAELIEGNKWHDQIWGDCFCGRPACEVPGDNLLGKLLMELRADLSRWFVAL